MNAREILLALAIKNNGDWDSIYNDLVEKVMPPEEVEYNGKYITILDEEYPEELKHILKPPFILFYEGNIDLLKENNKIAIVGTREPSEWGTKAIEDMVKKAPVVINGFGRGTETIAIERAGNNSIAVLPEGIKKTIAGLTISELPPMVYKSANYCSFRQRIIAGLCSEMNVAECKKQSGTLGTINYALEFGKTIKVLPVQFGIDYLANNELIRDGAEIYM